jgi:uncharacterized phage protein (TIGR02218 family)
MSGRDALIAHLQTCATTTCRAWRVTRKDGRTFGFTDHDENLAFEGTLFKANSGLSAGMLQKTMGLAVDNTEVVGSLIDTEISEIDLVAGRFDGADVVNWLVNWRNVEERMIRFRGNFGEIHLEGGAFSVELRGLSEKLNHVRGRIYQPSCPAMLGDKECRVDLSKAPNAVVSSIKQVGRKGEYFLPAQQGITSPWFTYGLAEVLSGPATGLMGTIRSDQVVEGLLRIEIMPDFKVIPGPGDAVRLIAGCDKMPNTCRAKFGNFLNFRGFPDVPSSDWMASYPVATQMNNGGSRTR